MKEYLESYGFTELFKAFARVERVVSFVVGKTSRFEAEMQKARLVKTIVEGLESARHFRQPDVKEIEVNGKKVWVDDGSVITLM